MKSKIRYVPYWLCFVVMLICYVNTAHGKTEGSPALTLSEIRSRVLAENPLLVAYRQEVLIGSSHLKQTERLINPEFSFGAENFLGEGDFAGSDLMEITAQISQMVELGGKRSARIVVAQSRLTERKMLLAQKEAEIQLAAGEAYLQVLISQLRVRQAHYSKDIAAQVFRTVREKVDAGKTQPWIYHRPELPRHLPTTN